MDILGNLDFFGGETRKERDNNNTMTFKERTVNMDMILEQTEMGNVCIQFQSMDHYRRCKEETCKSAGA
eukprot:8959730-Heterocapsa_arctica.AAC.1